MNPLNHAEANVRIFAKGIGICCYNKTKEHWEIAFLQDQSHSLNVRIISKSPNGVNEKKFLINSNQQIHIATKNCVKPAVNSFTKNSFALNSANNHPEDFRHVVDLEGNYAHSNGIRLKKDHSPIVFSTISDAIFYSAELSLNKQVIRKKGAMNETQLGRVCAVIGGDINFGTSGTVSLNVTGVNPFTEELSNQENLQYEIWLDNDCYLNDENANDNDFHLYYQLIEGDGEEFEVDLDGELILFGRTGDCHLTQASQLGTLEGLIG